MGWLSFALRLVPLVVGAVQAVESIYKKDPNKPKDQQNKERQDAAVDAIGAMIATIEATTAKEIMDEEGFKVLLRRMIDDYIAVQNFIRDWQETHKQ